MTTLAKAKALHPLAGAVLRQLGGGRYAIESAKDAANYGASGGFCGFTYYSDTHAFTSRNRRAIAEAVRDMADSLGEDPIVMVQGFGCFRHDKPDALAVAAALTGGRHEDRGTVDNALAWFALEEVGRVLVDGDEG